MQIPETRQTVIKPVYTVMWPPSNMLKMQKHVLWCMEAQRAANQRRLPLVLITAYDSS